VNEKINSNLRALKPLKEMFKEMVIIRVFPFPPSFALTIVEGNEKESVIQVKLMPLKNRIHPRIELSDLDYGNWYQFFLNQFEEMWKNSKDFEL
jgi:hypothetical protein